MATLHVLKSHQKQYTRLMEGKVPVQLRLNDRDYKAGDRILLREWIPNEDGNGGVFTGNELEREIIHVSDDIPGLMPGYVLFTTMRPALAPKKD